jgi:16S rRNA (adenine1518-N6/adenine1519-N6)-dimethyltransferase
VSAGNPGRPPWAGLKDELVQSGFRPSRRLGQNFLLDENLLRAIVRDAGVGAGDVVLEVGPGLGFLTRHLLASGAHVVAVEVDPRLAERVRAALGSEPRLRLLVGDVLAGKHALAPQVLAALPAQGPWHLVANLPYAVSGPVLAVCAALPNPPRTMTALVQLEMGARVAARAGTADWGPLSIRLQALYGAALGRRVPPELFWPRPQVDSVVVRLDLRPDPLPPPERERLSRLVERLFQRRRQRLVRVLSELSGGREAGERWARAALLGGDERAEDLPLDVLAALARATEARVLEREGPVR